jgi:hypothetical protein
MWQLAELRFPDPIFFQCRQAHNGDTVLVMSCYGARGRRGKDDRKQNTLAPCGIPHLSTTLSLSP